MNSQCERGGGGAEGGREGTGEQDERRGKSEAEAANEHDYNGDRGGET